MLALDMSVSEGEASTPKVARVSSESKLMNRRASFGKNGPPVLQHTPSMADMSLDELENMLAAKPSTPGPGAYTPTSPSFKRSPSFSIGSSKRKGLDSSSGKAPGPGNYSPDATKVLPGASPKGGRMGSASRWESEDGERKNQSPGPQAYSPKANVISRAQRSASFSFPRSKSPGISSPGAGSSPGPASYSTSNCKVSNVRRPASPKIGTAKRFGSGDEKLKSKVGPGQYSTHEKFHTVKKTAPSHRIPQASRFGGSQERPRSPGPGAYSPSRHAKSTVPGAGSFGKSSRWSTEDELAAAHKRLQEFNRSRSGSRPSTPTR